jgi:hypothetical protein
MQRPALPALFHWYSLLWLLEVVMPLDRHDIEMFERSFNKIADRMTGEFEENTPDAIGFLSKTIHLNAVSIVDAINNLASAIRESKANQ